MSYGNRPGQPLSNINSSVVAQNAHIVTPEQFALTQARLNDAKAILASYQTSNEMGYEAYLRLQQSVDDGERAKLFLQNALRPNQSIRAVLPSNLLGPSHQPVGGQRDYMQSTAKIEEVVTPSLPSATPVVGPSYARPSPATTSEGGFNIRPFPGGQGYQRPSDSRQDQSSSEARNHASGSQVPGSSIPTQQWWYGEQPFHHQQPEVVRHEQDFSTQMSHPTPALHYSRPVQNYAQPVAGSMQTTYVAPVPQTSTSSLHGALGQTTLTGATSTSTSKSGHNVTKTVAPTLAGLQPNAQSFTLSAQALSNTMISSSASMSSSSRLLSQVETPQNSISTETVDHGANRAAEKSLPVSNAEFLKIIREWSRKAVKISSPIPYSNLWVFKNEGGKVDIVCMAEPRSITPLSTPIRPFIYTDLTGNFQLFDKAPAPPLHYYPPNPQLSQSEQQPSHSTQQPQQSELQPPRTYKPYSQTGIGGINQNVQTPHRSSLPQRRPTARVAEQISPSPPSPVTPAPQRPSGPRTPAQVHKKHLARDILRSLGVSPAAENRKRQRGSESDADSVREGSSKRQLVGQDLSPTEPAVDQSKHTETGIAPAAAEEAQRGSTDGSSKPLDGKEQVAVMSHPVQPPSNPFHVKIASFEAAPAPAPPSQAPLTPPISHALPQPLQSYASPHSTPTRENGAEVDDNIEGGPDSASMSRIATPPASTPSPSPPIYATQSPPGPSKVPLFLPSASNSPGRSSVNDSVIVLDDMLPSMKIIDGSKSPPRSYSGFSIAAPLRKSQATGRKRPQVYVLVPPLPEWARREQHKGKMRASPELDDEIPGGRSQPAEDSYGIMEESGAYGAVERTAAELSRSRLCEQLCGWKDCEAVLNSAEALCKHIVEHAQDDNLSGVYCMWQHCIGKKFSDVTKLTLHLQSHAQTFLFCSYRYCDERFRSPRELVKHHASNHNEHSLLKPSVDPFKPRLPLSLGPIPRVLPSYLVEARSVRQAAISQDRHALLGPWVLRNICGPIDLGPRKQGVAAPQGTGFYEYDFLASNSTHKPPRLEDIDSVAVSRLVHSGVIFWNPEDVAPSNDRVYISPDASVQEHDNPEFHGSEATLAEPELAAAKESENEEGFTPNEEEAVELMLGVL